GRRFADDVGHASAATVTRLEIGQLLSHALVGPRLVDDEAQLVQVDRLHHVIEGAELHGVDGGGHGGVGGDHEHLDGRQHLAQTTEHFDAVHSGQPHVDDGDVGARALGAYESVFAREGDDGAVPV